MFRTAAGGSALQTAGGHSSSLSSPFVRHAARQADCGEKLMTIAKLTNSLICGADIEKSCRGSSGPYSQLK